MTWQAFLADGQGEPMGLEQVQSLAAELAQLGCNATGDVFQQAKVLDYVYLEACFECIRFELID